MPFHCRARARSGREASTAQARRNDDARRRSNQPVRGGRSFPGPEAALQADEAGVEVGRVRWGRQQRILTTLYFT